MIRNSSFVEGAPYGPERHTVRIVGVEGDACHHVVKGLSL